MLSGILLCDGAAALGFGVGFGVGLYTVSGSIKDMRDRDAFRVAFLRGKKMNQSILDWDPWPHMERPLEDVRAELGVVPIDAIPAVP